MAKRKEVETVRKIIEQFRFEEFRTKYYTRYFIIIQILDRILGGIPVAEKLLDYWLSKKHMSDEEKADLRERIKKGEANEELDEKKKVALTAFERDEEGYLVIMNANFKACLREAFSGLGFIKLRDTKVSDAKRLLKTPQCIAGGKNTFREYSNVKPRFSRLLIDDQPVNLPIEKETDRHGVIEMVKSLTDQFGNPMSALGAHEFLIRPTMKWVFEVPRVSCFTEEHVVTALAKAGDIGLGSNRGMGFGEFKIVSVEKEEVEDQEEKEEKDEKEII